MKKRTTHRRAPALLLTLLFLCSACGPRVAASTIELTKAEGTVEVADESGNPVTLQENMKLYSGCHVSTGEESCAWIHLDEAKLTKMDTNSQIEIRKSGNQLEILVNAGSLFFNLTEPLAAGETITIRSSAMAVSIQGGCGWVETPDEDHLNVYMLEGSAECAVPDLLSGQPLTSSAAAGGMAELTAGFGESAITVGQFAESDIPAFVSEALNEDAAPNSASAAPT